MTTDQWITAGLPLVAVILGIIRSEVQAESINARMSDLERNVFARISSLEAAVATQFRDLREVMNAKFEAQTSGLLRVAGVLDARLKHLEENAER